MGQWKTEEREETMGHTMEKWVNACGHQIPQMSIHLDVQDVLEQDKGDAISQQQMFGLVVCVCPLAVMWIPGAKVSQDNAF